LAIYLIPEEMLPPIGAALLLAGLVCVLLLRRHRRPRILVTLALVGLSVGLLWTALYFRIFFQPARTLDDRTVQLNAVVCGWPQETDYGYSVLVRVDTDSFVRLSAILYTDEQGSGLQPGDRISCVAHCTLGDRTFSGEEITYYTAKGIFLRAQLYGRLAVDRPEHIPLQLWPVVFAKELKAGIDAAFPKDVSPLICALVTGDQNELTDGFTTALQRTGLSHTVAVSGMHLAFLASLVSALLGRGRVRTAVVTLALVVLFCGMVGNTPSVLRAAVMIALLQLAPLLGREQDSPTALSTALMLQLLCNPFAAAHVGLQLSFGAVAGIILVSDPFLNWLLDRLHLDRRPSDPLLRQLIRIPRFFVSVLCATVGASVLTVPLSALYFGRFSLIAPLSNLMTLWQVSVLFLAGMLLGALGMVWSSGAAVLAVPFVWLARCLAGIIQVLSRPALASISLGSFYYQAWMLFFCVLMGFAMKIRGKRKFFYLAGLGVVTLTVSFCFTRLTFQSGTLTAVVLDVGQGQSVLLRMGSYLALVDCGGDSSENAGDVAADYIQSLGRSKLDLLVLSHYHTDHANGISELLQRVDVSAIALPDVEEESELRQTILDLAEERGIPVWFIREDTHLSVGEGQEMTLFAPLDQGTETNELGLTVLATAGEFDVLMPGDMNGEVEQLLVEHTALPDIELLVVGHHGSKYSTTQALLDATKPDLAVVSVGEYNHYGHPDQSTLERLDAAGAALYRTDLQGTVVIRSGD
jgi:competence protein ComEC